MFPFPQVRCRWGSRRQWGCVWSLLSWVRRWPPALELEWQYVAVQETVVCLLGRPEREIADCNRNEATSSIWEAAWTACSWQC